MVVVAAVVVAVEVVPPLPAAGQPAELAPAGGAFGRFYEGLGYLAGLILAIMAGAVFLQVVLRYIGSRRPQSDPDAAEAIAMAEADRRREAARRPTGGTGMWQ